AERLARNSASLRGELSAERRKCSRGAHCLQPGGQHSDPPPASISFARCATHEELRASARKFAREALRHSGSPFCTMMTGVIRACSYRSQVRRRAPVPGAEFFRCSCVSPARGRPGAAQRGPGRALWGFAGGRRRLGSKARRNPA
ncbi:unnamed protein product, partial [Amoebophrya sp. A120]